MAAINSISVTLAKGSHYCYRAVPDSNPRWLGAQALGEDGIGLDLSSALGALCGHGQVA